MWDWLLPVPYSKRVRIIAPTARYSDGPLFRRPIIPTTHYSDSPLLRRPIFPTMQNRTQSTNPWFNQVYPTGWSVSQANLDGPWPRQNVLERQRSFYLRLCIPAPVTNRGSLDVILPTTTEFCLKSNLYCLILAPPPSWSLWTFFIVLIIMYGNDIFLSRSRIKLD